MPEIHNMKADANRDSKRKDKVELLVAKNAGLSFGGNIANICFKLAISIVLTRSLGPQFFGIYILTLSIISFGEIIALFGLENTLIKFVAEFRALGDAPRLRGAVFGVVGLVAILSSIVCAGLFLLSPYLAERIFGKPNLIPVIKIMAFSLPFTSLHRLSTASLQGVKLIKYKVFVQQLFLPFSRLSLFIISVFLLGYGINGIVGAYVVTEMLGAIFSVYFLIRHIPEIQGFKPVTVEPKRILSFSSSLFFSTLFKHIMHRADVLIMGYFLPMAMIGIYGIAKRFTPFIILPLQAFNNIFAPMISDLYTNQKMKELENQFKTIARWIFTCSLPIFTLLTFYSEPILSIFGTDFVAGYAVMILLCMGQIVNAASGSVGYMLMMTGRPLANTFNSFLLCITNVVLNIYLIPRYGIIGAAFAFVFSNSLVQLLRLLEVWYFLKVHPYRQDFIKPILSSVASILLLKIIHHFGINEIHTIMLPFLFILYMVSYTGFLWLMKFAPEDHIVLNEIKSKLLKIKN